MMAVRPTTRRSSHVWVQRTSFIWERSILNLMHSDDRPIGKTQSFIFIVFDARFGGRFERPSANKSNYPPRGSITRKIYEWTGSGIRSGG